MLAEARRRLCLDIETCVAYNLFMKKLLELTGRTVNFLIEEIGQIVIRGAGMDRCESFFTGAGIHFSDEDIKTLIPAVPYPTR